MKTKTKRKGKLLKALIIIICIIAALAVFLYAAGNYKSNPDKTESYETANEYILEKTAISGHRSGGGVQPEETMVAFKNCVENPDFDVDVFEFDLHITKDDVLVLLHDDTLDRTSDCVEVFGEENVRPEEKTYSELRQLNMGYYFETDDGEMPYHDAEVTDDLRILRVEDALDYLLSTGDYNYIIEIKNGGELGMKGVDILHSILEERELVDKVIFGTFHGEISRYVDNTYPDMTRSTGIKEALSFWWAALTDSDDYEPPCSVLQLPYCPPYKNLGINTATAKVINYAHKHNMAIQYWTVNDEKDMEYLAEMGADCIMSDYPDKLYDVINGEK